MDEIGLLRVAHHAGLLGNLAPGILAGGAEEIEGAAGQEKQAGGYRQIRNTTEHAGRMPGID